MEPVGRAKEAAESLVRAERQKKRLAWFAGLLVFVVLLLGLLTFNSENKRLALASQLNAGVDFIPVLRKQIAADDDLLEQYANQEQGLRNQIGFVADPAEKKPLESKLAYLLSQKSRVQRQRDEAETTLSAESRRRIRVNPVDGLTYVFIPQGAFIMGCSPGDNECFPDEKPAHAEQIANGFWLAQTEVTQAAWKKVMNNNPSRFKSDQLPVENVDWNQAGDYCKAIGGRLPTEKEWEYAGRGGITGGGYGPIDAVAWYENNSVDTT